MPVTVTQQSTHKESQQKGNDDHIQIPLRCKSLSVNCCFVIHNTTVYPNLTTVYTSDTQRNKTSHSPGARGGAASTKHMAWSSNSPGVQERVEHLISSSTWTGARRATNYCPERVKQLPSQNMWSKARGATASRSLRSRAHGAAISEYMEQLFSLSTWSRSHTGATFLK